jgi:hypothetical protein
MSGKPPRTPEIRPLSESIMAGCQRLADTHRLDLVTQFGLQVLSGKEYYTHGLLKELLNQVNAWHRQSLGTVQPTRKPRSR